MEEYEGAGRETIAVMRQIDITMRLAFHILAQGERSFRDALEMCSRLRDYVCEHCPDQPALFDLQFAPRLREILHLVYD